MNYIIIYNHQHLIAKPPDLFPAPQMIKRISFVLKLFLISLSGVAIKLLKNQEKKIIYLLRLCRRPFEKLHRNSPLKTYFRPAIKPT